MKYLATILLFILMPSWICTQSNIPIGSWKSYLPYKAGKWVTQSPEKVIYATEWSLMTIDKEERSIDFISKVEGLSDVGIDFIDYDEVTDQLVIVYSNSNIDIFSNEKNVNLPNIKSNQSITGDKSINSVHTSQDGYAYLATAFGLVQIDLNKYEFGFTTFTGVKVNDVTTTSSHIYIATDDGAYAASLMGDINLGDFTNWMFLGAESGLPIVYQSNSIAYYNESLFIEVDNTLFVNRDTDTYTELFTPEDNTFKIQYLSTEGSGLIIGTRDPSSRSRAYRLDTDWNIIQNGGGCTDRTRYAIEDQKGRIWYADDWNGFRNSESFTSGCDRIQLNTPNSHKVSNIEIKDNEVFVASGGVTDAFGALFEREGYYILKDGSWTNVNQDSQPIIRENDILNFYEIIPHPTQDIVFAGSYWGGVVEWNRTTEEVFSYDQFNSGLDGTVGDEQRERIAGFAFDNDENLWISNFGAARPIVVFTKDRQWANFRVESDTKLVDIAIDNNNNKWFVVQGNSGGVLVYDSGNDVESTSDDEQVFLNISNSEITSNKVNAIAVDQEGSIWVGTGEGPVIFDCGSDIQDCSGRRIKVLQDSIPAFLLADVDITDIAIDGADRKWFASQNGIFVQSPDGQTQELRFTSDNSPLFDDNVIELAYNNQTGEMFIGTDKGLQSFRTQTTGASDRHSSNVYAYPNPVPPDYSGPIAITGLAQNADIKITDINGQIVYETTALGGQAIWDGNNFNGVRATSGVYLVFSTSSNTFFETDSYVTKILLLD